MTAFLVVGALRVVLLVALVLGDVLDGALEGLSAGFFSTEALAGFLGALGFGGAIALSATGSTLLAVVIGLVLGVLLGGAAAKASAFLHGTGETDSVRTSDMVEKIGSVVSAIPADGFGVVSISVGGHITRPGDPARAGEGGRRQAALKERELDTEVRKPAGAERYRVETEAQGRRNSQILEAEAK